MVAIFFALAGVNQVWHHPAFPHELDDPEQLAGYLGTIENGQSFGILEGDRGIGAFGGSEDHTAILCSRPGALRQYSDCPVRFQHEYLLPSGYAFAIASSGVVAEKAGPARERYNQASALAGELSGRWRIATGAHLPHLAAILHHSTSAESQLCEIVTSTCADADRRELRIRRFEHFVAENEQIIPEAGRALAKGDLVELGRWVDRSQQAAER